MQHISTRIAYTIEDTYLSKLFSLLLNKKTFFLGAAFTVTAGITYYLFQKENSPAGNLAKTESTNQDLSPEPDSTFFVTDADTSDLTPQSLLPDQTAASTATTENHDLAQPKSPLVEGRHRIFQPLNASTAASTASNCSEIPQSSRSNTSSYDVVDHDDADPDDDPTKSERQKSPLRPPALQPVPRKESTCHMM